MKIMKQLRKRGLALFMALIMCLSLLPANALAAEADAHLPECGYVCTHAHDESCGAIYTEPSTDPADGYIPAVTAQDEVNCPNEECTGEEEGHVEHVDAVEAQDEVMGVKLVVDESLCTHQCDGSEWVCAEDCPVMGGSEDEAEEQETSADEEIPAEVQAFLDAVAAIPDDINADNAEEVAELLYGEVADAYEVLLGTEYEDREDVQAAVAVMAEAIDTVNAVLEMDSGTYGLVSGNYGGFVYSPRGEFTATDGTPICVQKWDFDNPKHPYEYYNYLKYWYDKGSTQYEQYLPYAEKSDSSCFERCQNFIDRGSFIPQVLTRTVEAGTTAVFGYLVTTTDHQMNFGSQVPSVYLYDVVDVTQGEEYIEGGRDAIRFYASDAEGLKGLWPYVSPNNPHIRMDTPISDDAPKGTDIQIRFRLAYGFEAAWWGNPQGYSQSMGKGDPHRENNYYWYVEDFVYTMTVGGSGSTTEPEEPDYDADVVHHVYMPAGTSTTLESYVPYLSGGSYTVSGQKILENGNESVATAGSLSKRNYSGRNNSNGEVLQIPITSAAKAETDATTTIWVQQKWNQGDYTCIEKIVVHIIDPRKQELAVNDKVTMPVLGSGSFDETIQTAASSNTAVITVSSSGKTGYTATRKAAGDASVEYQYRYVENVYSGYKGGYYWNLQPINYRQQIVYVDVTNFDENDDPNSIDGLRIKKEGPETVQAGSTITYTITVTNDSGVDKLVTVTDVLPYGTVYKSSESSDSAADVSVDDLGTLTWKPTVKAHSVATLTITCDVADNARGYLNNKVELASANGDKLPEEPEHTVSTQVTPKPAQRTKTVTIVKVFIGNGGNKLTQDQIPADFCLDYSYIYSNKTTSGQLTVDVATKGTDENGHPTLTWTLEVPVDQAATSTNRTPLTITELNYDKVTGYTWAKQTGLNEDGTAAAGTFDIDASTNSPANSIYNYYDKQTATPDPEPELMLEVTKNNAGFKVDPQTGNATVDYTVTVTNKSEIDLYGLRLTDTMTTDPIASNEGVTYTFSSFKVDGKAITPISGGANDMEHVLQLVERNTKFAKNDIVILTYTVEIVNNGDDEVAVNLDNKAKADSWDKQKSETRALSAVMPLADDDDPPAVSGEGGSNVGGSAGGSTSGTLPGKYTVSYSWTGLPEGANETLPTGGKYPAGATVTVDTTYNSESTVTVDGATYTFSGWDREDFEMPAKNVTITGTWTKTAEPAKPLENIQVRYLVQWLDADGNELKNTEVRGPEAVGTKVEVTEEDTAQITKNGSVYTFDESAANVLEGELKAIKSDADIVTLKLYFKKTAEPAKPVENIQVRYLVQWLDEDGNELKNTEVRGPEAVGTKVEVTEDDKAQITKNGSVYTFDESAANVLEGELKAIKSDADIITLKLYFKKTAEPAKPLENIQVRYLVQWLDEDGNELKNTEVRGPEAVGTKVEVTEEDKAQITKDGSVYTFDESAANVLEGELKAIKSDADIVTLKLYFTQNPVRANYTVEWRNAANNSLIQSASRSGNVGETVAVTDADKVLDGYTFDADNAGNVLSAELKESGTVLVLYFTQNPIRANYTVEWRNAANNSLIQSVSRSGNVGETVAVTDADKVLNGYTFDADNAGNVLSAELKESGTVLVLYFTQNPIRANYTVEWRNAANNSLIQSASRSGNVGETVAVTDADKVLDGYTFDADNAGNVLSAELKESGTVLVLYFTRNTTPTGPVVPGGPSGGTTIPPSPPPASPAPGENIEDENPPLANAVGLNNMDHFAYVIGYEDDTVRPLNNITRAEAATIFFRLMTDEYRTTYWATTNGFSDVDAGAWYNNAISTCANAGLLKGYEDGTFRPEANITRAEFATLAASFMDQGIVDDGKGDFSDTVGHWAAASIRRAVKAGWIKGDGSSFRPDEYITRADVMILVNNMLDRVPDEDHMLPNMHVWRDNPKGTYYYEAVQEATNEHKYERDEMSVETWTELLAERDWKVLEAQWAANGGASAPAADAGSTADSE